MYIAIDRDRMVILWKNHSYKSLCDVAWIERRGCVCIVPMDITMLTTFTAMERNLLFRNTFNVDYFGMISVESHIFDLCGRWGEANINEYYAESQAATIKENDPDYWQYAGPAIRPIKLAAETLPLYLQSTVNPNVVNIPLPKLTVDTHHVNSPADNLLPVTSNNGAIKKTAVKTAVVAAVPVFNEDGSFIDKPLW